MFIKVVLLVWSGFEQVIQTTIMGGIVMSFTGMDIGQVRQLATQFKAKADEIESIMNTLTSALGGAQWVGPDRQKFEGDWSGQYCSALRNVAEGLRTAATTAEQNAQQQEQASNA